MLQIYAAYDCEGLYNSRNVWLPNTPLHFHVSGIMHAWRQYKASLHKFGKLAFPGIVYRPHWACTKTLKEASCLKTLNSFKVRMKAFWHQWWWLYRELWRPAAVFRAAVFRSKILRSNHNRWLWHVRYISVCKRVHARAHTEMLEVPEVLMANKHKANSVRQTVRVKRLCVHVSTKLTACSGCV